MDPSQPTSPISPLPYDTLPNGKIILQWREITPYVYMDKVCEAQKIFLIYSSKKSLTLQTDQGVITPSESPIVHELIRKKAGSGETSVQMVMRYAFCVGREVTTMIIKNGNSESQVIFIDSAFISNNVGLVVAEDRDYMDAMARAIEQAETQRSLALESLKFYVPQEEANGNDILEEVHVEDYQNYHGQDDDRLVLHDTIDTWLQNTTTKQDDSRLALQDATDMEEPVKEDNSLVLQDTTDMEESAKEDDRLVLQDVTDREEPVKDEAVAENVPARQEVKEEVAPKEIEKEPIPIETIDPAIFTQFSRETFISTTDQNITFDYEKVTQGRNGNGFKVQIIAKLLNDHNAKSIQQYYGLKYTVEEHYDGVWRRYTISGYNNNWEEAFALLQEVRRDYGIEDAFISLYQDHERLGIYPCNTVGFAEWVQVKTQNSFEPFGSKTEYLAQQPFNW